MLLERRRAERRPAAGQVLLIYSDPESTCIVGSLLDISETGFRIRHYHPRLRSGGEVYFIHSSGEGRARVAWNSVCQGRVETGFLILLE